MSNSHPKYDTRKQADVTRDYRPTKKPWELNDARLRKSGAAMRGVKAARNGFPTINEYNEGTEAHTLWQAGYNSIIAIQSLRTQG